MPSIFNLLGSEEPPGECTFSDWSDYGPCSVSCGNGRRVRRRRLISVDSGSDAVACNGLLTEFDDCSQGPCPGNIAITRVKGRMGFKKE